MIKCIIFLYDNLEFKVIDCIYWSKVNMYYYSVKCNMLVVIEYFI